MLYPPIGFPFDFAGSPLIITGTLGSKQLTSAKLSKSAWKVLLRDVSSSPFS